MSMRTYWLSFVDPDTRESFGACVVEVSDTEMLADKVMFPNMPGDDERHWEGAAVAKAWQTSCNPGGEVMAVRMDTNPNFDQMMAAYPKYKLMSQAEAHEYSPVVKLGSSVWDT